MVSKDMKLALGDKILDYKISDKTVESGCSIKDGNLIYNNEFSNLIEFNREELEREILNKILNRRFLMDREKICASKCQNKKSWEKTLTKIQFERLYEAENLEEAVRHLNETAYSEDLAKIISGPYGILCTFSFKRLVKKLSIYFSNNNNLPVSL